MYAENTTGAPLRPRGRPAGVHPGLGSMVSRTVGVERTVGVRRRGRAAEGLRGDSRREREENVKASVPGTEQAQEAVVANSVPQTALVTRSAAKFAPHTTASRSSRRSKETALQYVVNASAPIVAVGSPTEYFGVQNGVWFVSNSLTGPWLVATTVPAVIYSIPASSPLHYVTYVKIYDSHPVEVVVGYTPGYTGGYVSGGCVVYGTGDHYPPWIGSYWYGPRTRTGSGSTSRTPVGRVARRLRVRVELGRRHGRSRLGLGAPIPGGAATAGGAITLGVSPGLRCGVGTAWRVRGVGTRLLGRHHGEHVPPVGFHDGGDAKSRRLQRVDREPMGHAGWPRLQLAHGRRGGGPARCRRQRVLGQLRDGRTRRCRQHEHRCGRRRTWGPSQAGGEKFGGQAAIRGPGGNTTTVGGIKGEQGGALRVGDDLYAGHDGNVYKRNDGGGWDQMTRPETRDRSQVDRSQADRALDRERAGRSNGSHRSGAARSGGYHGGSRGGMRGGAHARRRPQALMHASHASNRIRRGAFGAADRPGRVHVRLRAGVGVSHRQSRGVRELPRHERAVPTAGSRAAIGRLPCATTVTCRTTSCASTRRRPATGSGTRTTSRPAASRSQSGRPR